jgi:hypothetical protein
VVAVEVEDISNVEAVVVEDNSEVVAVVLRTLQWW